MLCTFTTRHGALIVQSDDIKAIEDTGDDCTLRFSIGNVTFDRVVIGTALENRDRIQLEELELIDRVNQHHLKAQLQAQMQQQLAAQPAKVQRGKAVR